MLIKDTNSSINLSIWLHSNTFISKESQSCQPHWKFGSRNTGKNQEEKIISDAYNLFHPNSYQQTVFKVTIVT